MSIIASKNPKTKIKPNQKPYEISNKGPQKDQKKKTFQNVATPLKQNEKGKEATQASSEVKEG